MKLYKGNTIQHVEGKYMIETFKTLKEQCHISGCPKPVYNVILAIEKELREIDAGWYGMNYAKGVKMLAKDILGEQK